jgi:hypothetical protein
MEIEVLIDPDTVTGRAAAFIAGEASHSRCRAQAAMQSTPAGANQP